MSKRSFLSKKVLLGLLIVLVAGGAWIYHNHNSNPNLAASKSKSKVTGTTSKPTPHKVPESTVTNGNRDGGVVDQNGKTSGTLPPSSQWVLSTSGNITLQLPSPNTTVRSGDTLSGLAKVSSVQFILKDNSVGLIAQGNLKVVDGKFSGILKFTPHSNSGKLEVYYPNPSNGAEEDIVEINVSFST